MTNNDKKKYRRALKRYFSTNKSATRIQGLQNKEGISFGPLQKLISTATLIAMLSAYSVAYAGKVHVPIDPINAPSGETIEIDEEDMEAYFASFENDSASNDENIQDDEFLEGESIGDEEQTWKDGEGNTTINNAYGDNPLINDILAANGIQDPNAGTMIVSNWMDPSFAFGPLKEPYTPNIQSIYDARNDVAAMAYENGLSQEEFWAYFNDGYTDASDDNQVERRAYLIENYINACGYYSVNRNDIRKMLKAFGGTLKNEDGSPITLDQMFEQVINRFDDLMTEETYTPTNHYLGVRDRDLMFCIIDVVPVPALVPDYSSGQTILFALYEANRGMVLSYNQGEYVNNDSSRPERYSVDYGHILLLTVALDGENGYPSFSGVTSTGSKLLILAYASALNPLSCAINRTTFEMSDGRRITIEEIQDFINYYLCDPNNPITAPIAVYAEKLCEELNLTMGMGGK